MKSDIKRVETLAIFFIILALLTRISPLVIEQWAASILGAGRHMDAATGLVRVIATLWGLVLIMVNSGIGVWLFISAAKDGRARWIWALFGLVGGLTAAVLYFLVDLAETLKGQRKGNGEQTGA
ncbi:MAG: hypothetical protein NT031_13260 [Planctomycetota bacterium]|nr:hypothetical protein [Planctomycetota bacterium]